MADNISGAMPPPGAFYQIIGTCTVCRKTGACFVLADPFGRSDRRFWLCDDHSPWRQHKILSHADGQAIMQKNNELLAEVERLRRIEAAARNVAETLNGGFVVCWNCGEQETTTDLDFARELYAALGVEPRK